MTRDWLLQAPDGTMVPVEHIRPLLERLPDDDGPRLVNTKWLAKHEGMSSGWWAEQCRAGRIPGAWREGGRAPWYLPREEAVAYLFRRRNQRNGNRSRTRGPYRRAP